MIDKIKVLVEAGKRLILPTVVGILFVATVAWQELDYVSMLLFVAFIFTFSLAIRSRR